MKEILVAYWRKDGLDIYRYEGGKPVLQTSGVLNQLQPVKAYFKKTVLIIGREHLMHVRKRYPLAPIAKLTKAVALEVKDIFPLSNPAFYCSISKNYSSYADVDIWGWETDPYEKVCAIFPCRYVVPEDMAFSDDDAQIRIFSTPERVTMLAHAGGRFIDGVSCPIDGFDEKPLSRFLFKLNQSGEEIKKINILGMPSFQPSGVAPCAVIRLPERQIPASLYDIATLDLKPFRMETDLIGLLPSMDLAFIMRLGVYLLAGYLLILGASWLIYKQAGDDLKSRAGEINRKISALDQGQQQEDYSAVLQEVDEKLKSGRLPIKVMNLLAKVLPQETFINKIVWNENKVEISIASKEPMAVVKALSSNSGVKKIGIKGAPFKDASKGVYTFTMTLEMAE